jgi:hypothetical protein
MFRPHLTEPGVETKITEKGTRLNDYTAKEKQNKRDKYKIIVLQAAACCSQAVIFGRLTVVSSPGLGKNCSTVQTKHARIPRLVSGAPLAG